MRTHHHHEYDNTQQSLEHLEAGIPAANLDNNILEVSSKTLLFGLALIVITALAWFYAQTHSSQHAIIVKFTEILASELLFQAILVGLLAQLVDGALGMAYGISATSFLDGIGASPAAASGAVHVSEIFTTAFSGVSHIKFGNVDKALFKRLVIPGVIGGIVGAYILTSIDGKVIKPFVTIYLMIMGIVILRKAFAKQQLPKTNSLNYIPQLALSGGFLDAVGGGGWGPIVTTTLIGRGNNPRKTIGTVNTAEFFVALATGISLLFLGAVTHWVFVAGLIIGGVFAAPFAAFLTSRLNTKQLLIAIGILITSLSIFNTYKALAGS